MRFIMAYSYLSAGYKNIRSYNSFSGIGVRALIHIKGVGGCSFV
ncbi:hypothetical protein MYVALT_G_00460 [Candidatus Vallotia tarda]|uniref:Uncharacterized protein n=1 Tax=Candidatus Vallotiella hemipterorum TaxID=1177213 RepID=A0A916JQY7_9BURK|nr:hypothetical protein MYVALT_G_00460 [Candidatus Vallotia tarda]